MLVDWVVYARLQSGRTVERREEVPAWVLGRDGRRGWMEWVGAWVGREVLAGPIWAVAFWGGVGVVWRGRRFWVGVDMKVHEVEEEKDEIVGMNGNKYKSEKARRD